MKVERSVKIWLLIGLLMIFFQIVIGGITRLTGSGLSITEWEIVTGTFPPMNNTKWIIEFEKYKATPQYQKINEGMSLGEFKFIYFWEYIHRLWARLMGFVFIIPFFWFVRKKYLARPLLRKLGIVILLAILVASFGWIMVASGLEDRPWVNAYKLSLHLGLALILFSYLLWVYFDYVGYGQYTNQKLLLFSRVVLILLTVQIFLGGMMSGMKAGLFFPTWPDMNGELIPNNLFNGEVWSVETMVHYDDSPNMSMIVQFFHRGLAYVIAVIIGIFGWTHFKDQKRIVSLDKSVYWMIALTILQVLWGIITVINCKAQIPVFYGSMHQIFAIFLLTSVLIMNFQLRREK